jgi:DNA-binding winged helix-turn-helix (wHTH) protein
MSSSPQARGLHKLRFDVYEVDPRAGELRKQGYRVPLEDGPFRALLMLLQHAPEVVTRAELQSQLWPADVFVDFDHGPNKAIGKVRRALNDSADKPRFVETVGRRGYRFIALLPPMHGEDTGVDTGTASGEDREIHRRVGQALRLAGAVSAAVLLLAFLFRPAMSKPQVVSVVQVTKSGEAWPLEPMATDGPRLYYQSLSQSLSSSASAANWRVKPVLLNGNEENVIFGTSDRNHSFRIRGLFPDDTEFLGLSRVGEQWMAVTLPVVGGSPRGLGSLLADDVAWPMTGKLWPIPEAMSFFSATPMEQDRAHWLPSREIFHF